MQRRALLHTALATAALGLATPLRAQAWPTRPVRLVVPFPPGGPTDSFARLYAAALGQQLGQTVVVENKAGASGTLGTLDVKRSPPDGTTLLFGTASTHGLYNLVQRKPQYDALQDFAFIAVLGGAPVAFAVSPDMPRTLKTVVIAAKLNPGKYNYGSPGNGTLLHVAAERMKQVTGGATPTPITHVPYKGSGPALQDLMGGQVDVFFVETPGALPLIQGGKVRALFTTDVKRARWLPDVPSAVEVGLPDVIAEGVYGVVGPAGLPEAVSRPLAAAIDAALKSPELTARFDQFAGVPVPGTSAAFASYVRGEFTELISEATAALNLEATAATLFEAVHAHPTLAEAMGEAALAVHGRAIHI